MIYALSFVAPVRFGGVYVGGLFLFLMGLISTVAYSLLFWKEPSAGIVVVCWLANPLFWMGLALVGHPQRSRRLLGGVLGMLAVLTALLWLLPWNRDPLLGSAYLLWCGSFVLLAVLGLIRGLWRGSGEQTQRR
jgi:hypothetical protein